VDLRQAQSHVPRRGERPGNALFIALDERGRRECRMLGAPAAARAVVESTRVSHRRQPKQSGIPCAMVYRLIRALPGVPGLIASVARSFPRTSSQRRGIRTTRFRRPRFRPFVQRLGASTAFHPNVRDGRETPLDSGMEQNRNIERCVGRARGRPRNAPRQLRHTWQYEPAAFNAAHNFSAAGRVSSFTRT